MRANISHFYYWQLRHCSSFFFPQWQDWEGQTRYAEYGFFTLANELNSYKLFIANYSGNAGDSLRYHNNTNFSTGDKDNDKCVDHCASLRKGEQRAALDNGGQFS